MTASENGWQPAQVGPDALEWTQIPGADASMQIQKGWPLAIMRAFAADYNAFIEPVYDADCGSWTPTNSVATSNHLNGTAMDLRWASHPFHIKGTFNAGQLATINELLGWYEDCIYWGGNWSDPIDEMHWQMGYSTWNNPHTGDFIARKVRADGFSTFRRGDAPAAPPPPPVLSRADGYALQIIAEGERRGVTPRGIQIALATGLVESNITVYANPKVPESMNIPHDAVGSDGYSVGIFQQQVRDTGNGWWWGDAATCMDPALSAGLFYDRLVKLDYNGGNSPGSYAQAVQSSAFPDRYDQRFDDAVAIYNRLSTAPVQGVDDLSAEAERMIKELYDEYTSTRRAPTRSFFGKDEKWGETPLGFLWNVDGSIWNQEVTWGYLFGVRRCEDLVNSVAQSGVAPESYAGQLTDDQGRWLSEFGQEWCLGLIGLRSAMQKAFQGSAYAPQAVAAVPVDNSRELADAQATIASLRDQNAQLQASSVPAASPAALVAVEQPAVPAVAGTTGESIGQLFDALEQMRLADALPIEGRAPLAALISVLSTKNGSQV